MPAGILGVLGFEGGNTMHDGPGATCAHGADECCERCVGLPPIWPPPPGWTAPDGFRTSDEWLARGRSSILPNARAATGRLTAGLRGGEWVRALGLMMALVLAVDVLVVMRGDQPSTSDLGRVSVEDLNSIAPTDDDDPDEKPPSRQAVTAAGDLRMLGEVVPREEDFGPGWKVEEESSFGAAASPGRVGVAPDEALDDCEDATSPRMVALRDSIWTTDDGRVVVVTVLTLDTERAAVDQLAQLGAPPYVECFRALLEEQTNTTLAEEGVPPAIVTATPTAPPVPGGDIVSYRMSARVGHAPRVVTVNFDVTFLRRGRVVAIVLLTAQDGVPGIDQVLRTLLARIDGEQPSTTVVS